MSCTISEYLPAASEWSDDEVGNHGKASRVPGIIGESFNGASLSKIVSYGDRARVGISGSLNTDI